MSHAQYTWSSFFHPSNFICRFDDVLADFVTNQIELIVFAIFSVCHFNASLVKITGTFTRCCTCTLYDNKYVGLVLKDSREKQQDRKREEVQGESRFVTKRAQLGGGPPRSAS